ncbi:flagellar motor switch phosphatase FliY [Anaerocolumna aminovalerica]|uniref:Flagellar motor switch protein FliN/FliY n=1 Tax=Anaerocolumna aminovalerica TaxID=1527 RepID=A0A1I5I4R6_9FIRM|nr:flagellar motor switch phosphatase FliY [Anaerocolumna aminovalerica]MBU5333385.1 flagellar motor switch phosphatase FliY [Anaerocolumna aminovalerica]MDU6263867.1 flagellar motor switch phosphatase FliY [Anaerocolumna aminovalerica]SFO55594.1 flagellar motor switch protein FliN/FliY [Anaerocolumna aminovalerica]
MDGMLSQEEINALLNGMSSSDDSDKKINTQADSLTDAEKDAIGEISNISMGTAATTLSSLVNQKVVITTPVVSYATWSDLADTYDRPCVFIQIYYKDGLDGNNILILKERDVKIITDLMMDGDGTNTDGDLSELHLSAISEAMNQMMGSASTSISSLLEKRVDISPPEAKIVDLNDTIDAGDVAPFLKDLFVKVAFKMEIGDLVDSELMQLYPFDFARDIYKKFVKDKQTSNESKAVKTSSVTTNAAQSDNAGMNMEQVMQPNQGAPTIQNMQGMQNISRGVNNMMPMMQDVNVQPAQFQPFTAGVAPVVQPENINLLMDVPLEVTVELGRTSKSIKDILDFTPGTIIELNKLAGEPIDVLVNGKFVAKGEVVVIEDSFGIRVTEIIK